MLLLVTEVRIVPIKLLLVTCYRLDKELFDFPT